jgi:hypothetical protein
VYGGIGATDNGFFDHWRRNLPPVAQQPASRWDSGGGTVCDVKRSYWQFFEWPALVPGDSAAR